MYFENIRPSGVCWCRNLNGEKVSTNCRVFILQHPHEEKRCLRTVPILEALIPKENCSVIKGKKFNPSRCPELKNELSNENSILMYPGQNAVDIEDLPPVGEAQLPYNIFILDGTWQQAKSMVRLSGRHISEYVIRRQPTDDALSTVEVVAVALSTLEQDWKIYSSLVEPLKLICQYQILMSVKVFSYFFHLWTLFYSLTYFSLILLLLQFSHSSTTYCMDLIDILLKFRPRNIL
ncbi:hypothetical protein Anas_13189 [Armadillidium nasatum]|uniref:tRNA-uridine aminocarboxypropyltransferase n=1 Tax=Armadillidium nasatum TaxID=96803 RepID=A0A5N5T3D2_9CRUS|nr:hypothetical protein Anas_13189 [Armadillidium nasatum]